MELISIVDFGFIIYGIIFERLDRMLSVIGGN